MVFDASMWAYFQGSLGSTEHEKFPCESWEEIQVYTAPWVRGTRMLQSFGVVKVDLEVEKLEDAFPKIEELIMKKAYIAGGNAVHGWECIVHLWEKPIRVESFGSCITLGPL